MVGGVIAVNRPHRGCFSTPRCAIARLMKYNIFLLTVFLLCACDRRDESQSQPGIGNELGTIRFPVTGNEKAREHVERGVKLLHHMTYSEADVEFAAAIDADPDCAIAYWGRAMTIVHPLWPDIPSESQLKAGWGFIEQARSKGRKSERESAYIESLAVYFDKGWEREEKDRLIDLDRAWAGTKAVYPDDLEAACFFALFHLAPARFQPPDKSYRIQRQSGLIVEEVLQQIPDHPGALHYQIHAYDFPALAGRALEMCGRYGEVAPDVPHALHMPTHIYTRAGLWDKSIELNLRAAAAAERLDGEAGGNGAEHLHTLDYAVYAYLQKGRHLAARQLSDQARSLDGPFVGPNIVAAAFAFASIPARCALESGNWEAASRLEPRQPNWFPWDERFIPQESIVHFARAIGSIRIGNLDAARIEIESHRALAERIAQTFPTTYWDAQAATQQLALQAWLALEEGRSEEALELMRRSAQLEAVTDKEAVTPGEVLPAGELLGDMLVKLDRHEEAMAAYLEVLDRSPNRFNSLYGSGRAAEAHGDAATAKRYYKLLVELAADADPGDLRLERARAYLATNA